MLINYRWAWLLVVINKIMANFVQEAPGKFCFVYSCDLNIPVRIKVGTLEGQKEKKNTQSVLEDPLLQFSGAYQNEYSDLYVNCSIHANGKPLCLPIRTSYKSFSTRWNWNEWVEFPIRYMDLPRNAVLGLTIFDVYGPGKEKALGGTSMALFGSYGCFRRGFKDLKIWPGREADCSICTKTPGDAKTIEGAKMGHLSKLVEQHRKGRMMSVDWLDRLTFREIEMVNEREKRESNFMYLTVEFTKFHFNDIKYTMVYFDSDGEHLDETVLSTDYGMVQEPDRDKENLVESKYHKLSHSVRIGTSDLDLKPNPTVRARLQNIIRYPPTQSLSNEEKSLIWQFRYYLSQDKEALTKFLRCVDWYSSVETDEALHLLQKWQPIDPAASLELLTPTFKGPVHLFVCKYAIGRLQCTDNEELLLYLLQLVQALRYDNPGFNNHASNSNGPPTLSADQSYGQDTHSQLEAQLSDAFKEEETDEDGFVSIKSSLELSDSDSESGDDHVIKNMSPETPDNPFLPFGLEASMLSMDIGGSTVMTSSVIETEFTSLASFLIARSCRSTRLANYFNWYLFVECQEDRGGIEAKKKYEMIRQRFLNDLKNSNKIRWRKRYTMLKHQEGMVNELITIMKTLLSSKEDRLKRIERLQSMLTSNKSLVQFDQPIRLPVDPYTQVTGIIPEDCFLFKSALMPARFMFKTLDGGRYPVMFKLGDDLRQDQLILQMITLIDRLLQRENLDLKLTPYKVLACSSQHGFVQLVQKTDAVAYILSTYKTIQTYFQQYGPNEKAPYGISPEIMDTYVKSCAGYCVMTYLLSVGDRHLDNLLLTELGHLIHIDFGYILGRDPKIFPPPMRLSKEMVDAMGGTSSKEFTKFREHCYNAFLTLRRSANLFLNLFALMLDSGIPDIALEPDKTVQKVEDKFCLHLTEEEAIKYLQGLIDISIRAIFPELMEKIHKLAQDFRK